MIYEKQIPRYFHFLEFLEISCVVYLQIMDKKSTKIIDSDLRNVTKAIPVPKRDLSLKCEFASKQ